MKRINFLLLLLLMCSTAIYSQSSKGKYHTDIHGHLVYESNDGFKATLSRNIFGDKVYKDSRGNEVKYGKKFLERISAEEESEFDTFLLSDLVHKYKRKRNVKKEYNVDILDSFRYKNSSGKEITVKKNIFGNTEVSDNDGNKWEVKRDIFGDLIFTHNHRNSASLKKNIFDERVYSDVNGNEIKYNKETWEKLMDKFGNDEKLFSSLLTRFFQKE